MKKTKGFLFGLILGVVISTCISAAINSTDGNVKFKYVQLKEDYQIEDVGQLKSGTILRIDQSMSENFTRYILYLNLGSNAKTEPYQTERENEVIPYWLQSKEN